MWRGVSADGGATSLTRCDLAEGILGNEVIGELVGTLFRDLKGIAVVPVFFVGIGGVLLTITRVLSGEGAWA